MKGGNENRGKTIASEKFLGNRELTIWNEPLILIKNSRSKIEKNVIFFKFLTF